MWAFLWSTSWYAFYVISNVSFTLRYQISTLRGTSRYAFYCTRPVIFLQVTSSHAFYVAPVDGPFLRSTSKFSFCKHQQMWFLRIPCSRSFYVEPVRKLLHCTNRCHFYIAPVNVLCLLPQLMWFYVAPGDVLFAWLQQIYFFCVAPAVLLFILHQAILCGICVCVCASLLIPRPILLFENWDESAYVLVIYQSNQKDHQNNHQLFKSEYKRRFV